MLIGISKLNGLGRKFDRPNFVSAITGNVSISTSLKQFGSGSALFDGSGDSIVFPSDPNFALSDDFTVECWVYFFTVGVNQGLFDFRLGTANETVLSFRTTPTELVGTHNGTAWFTTTGASLAARTWYHIAVTRTGTTTRCFVNGTQRASTTSTRSLTQGRLTIGGLSGANNNPLNGFIDEFRISKGIGRYTSAFTPSATAFENDQYTTLLLHFNDYNGSTIFKDDTGDPITEGTRPQLTATVAGNSQISTAQSKFGASSGLFDGTGDYIRFTSDTLRLLQLDFTIECWVRPLIVTGDGRVLYDQRTATTQVNPFIYIDTNAALIYYVNGAIRIQSANSILTTNTWHHIAISRSGTSTRMFVNGTQVGSTYTDSNSYIGNPVFIATSYLGASGWNTYIDELRVSNTARYTAAFTPSTEAFTPDANTLLLLHMEGANASTTFTDSVS